MIKENTGRKINKKLCIVFCVLIVIVVLCFFLSGKLSGKKDYIEGEDIEIISNRFTNISDIIRCYYVIDIVSAGGIGPTRYNMKALVIIDEQESEYLKEQYSWKTVQIDVDEFLYKGVEIGTVSEWLYCNEFCSDTLGGSFVGKVYFSAKDNCIYIIAGV